MYNFKDKYLLQGNIRYDGSSCFAKAYRWGIPFLLRWMGDFGRAFYGQHSRTFILKFRISYGKLGNERIGNYPYQSLIQFSNALFQEGDAITSVQTAAQQSYVIEDISGSQPEFLTLVLTPPFLIISCNSPEITTKATSDMLLELEIRLYRI